MARVLVIDDEPAVREMIVTMLRRQGHDVFDAGDGIEGLRVAADRPVDLVITDVVMPEMEGIGLIRELR